MIDSRKERWTVSSETFDSRSDCEDGSRVFSKEGKGKSLWRRVKYQLVEYHSLPGFLRDNEYILGHYRSEWPLKQVFLSVFYIHNETLNVWTHLIGFFIFLSLTIYTAMKVPKVIDLQSVQQLSNMLKNADLSKIQAELGNLPSLPNMADFHRFKDLLKTSLPSVDFLPSLSGWNVLELLMNCLPKRSIPDQAKDCLLRSVEGDMVNTVTPLLRQPITRWPFFAFLGGAMFCLLASSTCHLLSCYSERLSYIMLRLDYAGIAALIATSFYPPVYYSFMCNPFFCNLYLSFITILGIASIAFSLLPVFQKPHFRTLRASLFFGMGISGVAPIIHKLILYWNRSEALQTTGYEILMGAFYGIGALIYAKRIPERWRPGKFDIAGHSHQIFHVLVVAGAYTHYHTGLIYLRWRDMEGCSDQYPKADSDKNHWSRGVNVNEEGEEDEDEDLSMVSDASSGPRNFHEEENCLVDRGYFSYAASGSEQVKMSKQKKKIKENRAHLDDTASSPVLSFSKKVPNNQASSMEKEAKGFSETHSKGKSSTLKKKFGLLKSSVSGKSSSEKSGGSQGRKW